MDVPVLSPFFIYFFLPSTDLSQTNKPTDSGLGSCACGYANGYVNRMLQHVRHKFWLEWHQYQNREGQGGGMGHKSTICSDLSTVAHKTALPVGPLPPATLQVKVHGTGPKNGCDKLNPSEHSVEALITSGPNKLRQLRALVQSNGKLSPATFTLGVEAGAEAKEGPGGGIFPLYLRRTVTAKNPLQAPNKRQQTRRPKYTLTKEPLEMASSYIILFYLIFLKYYFKSEKILSQ